VFFYNPQLASDTETNDIKEVSDVNASAKVAADELREIMKAMHSIAVLPFANMTTSEAIGLLADGLSEDILDNLAQTEYLNVASRSASFQYTGRGEDPLLVGEQLGVGYLLEGGVRQQGDTLRITAQLIRTNNGFHVWSTTYERPAAEGFEMQSAVAANIAYITESEPGHDILANYGWKLFGEAAEIDPLAFKHWVNGVKENRKFQIGEGGNLATQIQLIENAIEVDPSFHQACVVLADIEPLRLFTDKRFDPKNQSSRLKPRARLPRSSNQE
jgi:TolB-like protein